MRIEKVARSIDSEFEDNEELTPLLDPDRSSDMEDWSSREQPADTRLFY